MKHINGEIQLLVNTLIFYNSDKAINKCIDSIFMDREIVMSILSKIKLPLLRNTNQVYTAIQHSIGYYDDIF